jgi:polyphosphate kinase 2 (PPK2 family)
MLEKIDLDLKLKKDEYDARREAAGPRLTLLQRAAWEAGIPSILVFEGWDAAGKGSTINFLTQYMDPRGFRIQAIKGATPVEQQMPWLWRFWLRVPNMGEVAIFDRSWYGRVMVERVEELVPSEVWREAFQDILEFERTLSESGYLILKFFLHISKKEQKRRFNRLEKDPHESWRVQKEDWKHHRKYKEYLTATEEMLARTETEWGPWTIVEATDRRWCRIRVLERCAQAFEEHLSKRGVAIPVSLEEESAPEEAPPETTSGDNNGKPADAEHLEVH